ncbi:hypothetical protein AB0R11_28120, partial [Streptomyces fradiae]
MNVWRFISSAPREGAARLRQPPANRPRFGVDHILSGLYLASPDVEETARKVREGGGEVVMGPMAVGE